MEAASFDSASLAMDSYRPWVAKTVVADVDFVVPAAVAYHIVEVEHCTAAAQRDSLVVKVEEDQLEVRLADAAVPDWVESVMAVA